MKKLLLAVFILLAPFAFCQEMGMFFIEDGDDDVNEERSQIPTLHDEYLVMSRTEDNNQIRIGLRYQNATIPLGAEITAAWIQFTSLDTREGDSVNMMIMGLKSVNVWPFVEEESNVFLRTPTDACVHWQTQNWLAFTPGPDQKTPDLSEIVQEIIDQDGWTSGNAMGFKMYQYDFGFDTLLACSWEYMGDMYAPILHVEYIDHFGIIEIPGVDKLLLYPNPASEMVNIRFNNEKKEYFQISINDLSGKEMYRVHDGMLVPDLQEFKITVDEIGMTSGLYFVNVVTSNNVATLKLLIR
ncbi:MAG: T9SS type A sorting domain-containing protein [Bacteroidota bacterium]